MRDFNQISKGLWIHKEYAKTFKSAGLDSIEKICNFNGGEVLDKQGLASFRKRIRLTLDGKIFYLKLYRNAPHKLQLRNWIDHRKKTSLARYDMGPVELFEKENIKSPKIVAYGEVMGALFEKTSLLITENIDDAKSLETSCPPFFDKTKQDYNLREQKKFMKELGEFTRRFHNLGLCHRDYYLCHIFWGKDAGFYIIDLQRVFKPLFGERFRVKDIAQLFYSSPASIYSKTMKLRLYLEYTQKKHLDNNDRNFLKKVFKRVSKMKRHDEKKHRSIPFEN